MQRILQLSPDKIGVRADLFQFKAKADRYGVTGALNGATWNPIAANVCLVWQPMFPREGEPLFVIVDGHQRHHLSSQAVKAGMPGVYLTCRVLSEGKGVSPEKARIQGALKNICENGASTKPYDIATLFRSGGDLSAVDKYLSNYNRNVQCAKTLMQCEDWLFKRLAETSIDDYLLAEIFDTYTDDRQRLSVIENLEKSGIATADNSAMKLISEAGFDIQHVESLFGVVEDFQSGMDSVVKLVKAAEKYFKTHARAYSEAVQSEDALSAVGNVLDRDANVRALQAVSALSKNLSRLALFDFKVTALIRDCAGQYQNSPSEAERLFIMGLIEFAKTDQILFTR